ncbi:MAG TPA: alpha/beta hydrolase, partial [Gemmatimonadaceae bacterium]|nr:alpha/beta hydrolase [Gemmatimonadaceae bacterium]
WFGAGPPAPGGGLLSTELRLRTDRGAARTLEAFLGRCGRAGAARCPFAARDRAATRARYAALLERLRRRPVRGTTYAQLVQTTVDALDTVQAVGEDPGWGKLASTLQGLWTAGPAARAAAAPRDARRYAGPEQQYAIYCGESPNPRASAFPGLARLGLRRSGAVGAYVAWLSEPCATWPATAADRYDGPWNHRTANPILVVGTTHDPSTPFSEARAMARELARARLLNLAGYGHTALLNPSACVERHETRYLLAGILPPRGTRCVPDAQPFAPAP